jgi:hypothetical protein
MSDPVDPPWSNLDPNLVRPRIQDLFDTPSDFQQGSESLCTAAVFFYHLFVLKPIETAQFAQDLFNQGSASLGGLTVAPGPDLINADYAAIFATATDSVNPPQCDWMLMCSIRDSTNYFIDFEGDPAESIAQVTFMNDLKNWYSSTGFFSNVNLDTYYVTDPSVTTLQAVVKTDTNAVALWIKAKLLASQFDLSGVGPLETHMIAVTQTPTIDEANNQVSLQLWTWGLPPKTLNVALDFFQDCIYAILVVTI